MKQIVRLMINNDGYEVAIEPYDSLLRVLRDRVGLIGTKRACDTGGCGCCTVLVDGKAIYSCMTYALSVQDKAITTVEGLMQDDQLDPLQDAFLETGAFQCGYCTCGILMAAKELLSCHPQPDENTIRKGISGNLCRCTGYTKIIDAIQLAAKSNAHNSKGEASR